MAKQEVLKISDEERQKGLDAPRICERCSEIKPLSQFHNQKNFVCKTCYRKAKNAKSRRYSKNLKEEERIADAISELITKCRADHIEAPHVSELCEEIVNRIGGVEVAAKHFVESYELVMREKMGERLALDYHKAFQKLVEASTEHRSSAPDIASLDNETLSAEIAKAMTPAMLKVMFPDEFDEAIKTMEAS